MGNNCEKQAIENFGIHSISYLYYLYQHTTTREAFVIGFPLAEDIGLILI